MLDKLKGFLNCKLNLTYREEDLVPFHWGLGSSVGLSCNTCTYIFNYFSEYTLVLDCLYQISCKTVDIKALSPAQTII